MAKIQIDEGDLLMAFESGDGMMEWFLDRETGTVIGLGDDVLLGDEDDEDDEDWEREEKALRRAIYESVDGEDGGRYLAIESISSNEGFRIMEDFAASQDGRARDALFHALDRHRPFRSFKDALLGFPEVREAWFRYHEERLREYALDWLRSEGIDAELTTPSPPD